MFRLWFIRIMAIVAIEPRFCADVFKFAGVFYCFFFWLFFLIDRNHKFIQIYNNFRSFMKKANTHMGLKRPI